MTSKHILSLVAALLVLPLLSGCDSFLDIVPKGQVIPSRTSEYRATLNNGYKQDPGRTLVNMRGITIDPQPDPFGMGLDEWESYKTIYRWEDTDNNSGRAQSYPYFSYYKGLFFANTILLADPSKVEEDDRSDSFVQLTAEAHALRAYYYFELVNLYGPVWSAETAETKVVPINNTIDTEQSFPPATLREIYDVILSDLEEAKAGVRVERYEDSRYRYRFSREAILALSSRVHLYRGEWEAALEEARAVLQISDALEDLHQTGDEALLPQDYRSAEAILSITAPMPTTISSFMKLADPVASLYPEGDLRLDRYFPMNDGYGYRLRTAVGAAYNVTLRRAEVYLTAAESAARLGQDEVAREYLLALLESRLTPEALESARAEVSAAAGDRLITLVLDQRLLELAQEGHDWYDFKRTTQPELRKRIHDEEVVLQAHDPRYVIPLPPEARENNPYLSVDTPEGK